VDLLGVSSYFPWFKVNRSNPKDCKGDDEKKRGGKKPRKEKKSKILAKKKKNKKKNFKRGQVTHIILVICWPIILVIVGQIVDLPSFSLCGII